MTCHWSLLRLCVKMIDNDMSGSQWTGEIAEEIELNPDDPMHMGTDFIAEKAFLRLKNSWLINFYNIYGITWWKH